MKIGREMVLPARVLHQDDDFITLEVAKHDGVSFTLNRDDSGETVGGDEFNTLVFVRAVDGHVEVWKPWETSQ